MLDLEKASRVLWVIVCLMILALLVAVYKKYSDYEATARILTVTVTDNVPLQTVESFSLVSTKEGEHFRISDSSLAKLLKAGGKYEILVKGVRDDSKGLQCYIITVKPIE